MSAYSMRLRMCGILLAFACGAVIASEARYTEVTDAWMREVPPGQSTSSGFLVLHNHGDQPVELVGAELDIAGVVELHTMSMNDQGQMSMRQVSGFQVEPGAHRTLVPRGDHLMLMRLNDTLRGGDQHELTLRFSDDSTATVAIEVRVN